MIGHPEPLRESPPEESVRQRLSTQAHIDTAPELALRRELWRAGLRYRVHVPIAGLPRRRPDIVFTRARLAVFVDGCFWHSCPQHAHLPRSNSDWWAWKLQANRERDRDTDRRLAELGWTAHRVWEHEDMSVAAQTIRDIVLNSRR